MTREVARDGHVRVDSWGGDVGWYWHLVEAALRKRGHEVVAPDPPCDDDSATLGDYADTVVAAVRDRSDLVVVGQSYGGFTAPLVADQLHAQRWSSCTVVSMRLGVTPDEIAAGHCVALSRPNELADMLVGHAVAKRDSEQ